MNWLNAIEFQGEEEEEKDSIFSAGYLQRYATANRTKSLVNVPGRGAGIASAFYRGGLGRSSSPCSSQVQPSSSSSPAPAVAKALILVFHGGTVLDNVAGAMKGGDVSNRLADVATLRQSLENVARQHFAGLSGGRLAVRLVPCPSLCPDALTVLNSLSPSPSDASPGGGGGGGGGGGVGSTSINWPPLGCLPLFAASSSEYNDNVTRTVLAANRVYAQFLKVIFLSLSQSHSLSV